MRRKAIPLKADDDASLRELYTERLIPIDQYLQRPADLEGLVVDFNRATGRDDDSGEIIHYMQTKRKQGKWVTFDGSHERLKVPEDSVLTQEQWHFVILWLQTNCETADRLATNANLVQQLNSEIALQFGRTIAPSLLTAAIMAKRKRGELPKLPGSDLGFGDIDEVA